MAVMSLSVMTALREIYCGRCWRISRASWSFVVVNYKHQPDKLYLRFISAKVTFHLNFVKIGGALLRDPANKLTNLQTPTGKVACTWSTEETVRN